jgi:hypothetical protein
LIILGSISISLHINWLQLILFAAIFGLYTYFIFKYTIPVISKRLKIFLIILRTVSLILILFVILEPVLTIKNKKTIEPVNLIFIDNSKSIANNDNINKIDVIKSFLNAAKTKKILDHSEIYSFGTNTKKLNGDNFDNLPFNEPTTNFSTIFSPQLLDEKNISSIVILSDGVITEGSNPIYTAERLGIPIYTIGVGDSSKRNDISVQGILFNDYIYANNPTVIIATILNKGYNGQQVKAGLYEENKLIEEKTIQLSDQGIQNISFEYQPKEAGEKKLSVFVTPLKEEYLTENNKKVFFLNVLNNKIKVLLISGSPSADMTFVKNSLLLDTNLIVKTITQIGDNKFLEQVDIDKLISSFDILFLIHFPTVETTNDLLMKVSQTIKDKNKPYFYLLSNQVNINKLKYLEDELPFAVGKTSNSLILVQPNLNESEIKNPLLQNSSPNILSAWNDLPPVNMPEWGLTAKPESQVLSNIKINNTPVKYPLIITRKIGNKRTVAVLASDIWKWKLQKALSSSDIYDRFILNCVKWLNAKDDKKQVKIETNKKFYSSNEQVEFNAEIYDESYNPINNAEVKVVVKKDNNESQVELNQISTGIYQGFYQPLKAGDYTFTGEAGLNEKKLGSDKGRFNVGDINIEMIDPTLNADFLELLSNQTKGKFFYNKNFNEIFSIVFNNLEKSSKEKTEVKEFNLWSNELLLFFIIILFSIEWFIRKREGML